MYCSKCGAELHPLAKFCGKCGRPCESAISPTAQQKARKFRFIQTVPVKNNIIILLTCLIIVGISLVIIEELANRESYKRPIELYFLSLYADDQETINRTILPGAERAIEEFVGSGFKMIPDVLFRGPVTKLRSKELEYFNDDMEEFGNFPKFNKAILVENIQMIANDGNAGQTFWVLYNATLVRYMGEWRIARIEITDIMDEQENTEVEKNPAQHIELKEYNLNASDLPSKVLVNKGLNEEQKMQRLAVFVAYNDSFRDVNHLTNKQCLNTLRTIFVQTNDIRDSRITTDNDAMITGVPIEVANDYINAIFGVELVHPGECDMLFDKSFEATYNEGYFENGIYYFGWYAWNGACDGLDYNWAKIIETTKTADGKIDVIVSYETDGAKWLSYDDGNYRITLVPSDSVFGYQIVSKVQVEQ